MEVDSLNCAILGDDIQPEQPEFTLFIKEVVREMTAKGERSVPRFVALLCRKPARKCEAGIIETFICHNSGRSCGGRG